MPLHFADAQTEDGQMAVTHSASPCHVEVPTGLSDSGSGRARARLPLFPSDSPPGSSLRSASPLPAPTLQGPPSGRADWPAWITCSSESQSTEEPWLCPPMAAPTLTSIEYGKGPFLCSHPAPLRPQEGEVFQKTPSPRAWPPDLPPRGRWETGTPCGIPLPCQDPNPWH